MGRLKKLKDAKLVSMSIDPELADELDRFAISNKLEKSEVIRATISSFLEMCGEDGEVFAKGGNWRKTTFFVERDVWERFGDLCGEIGISRSKMIQVLIKKLLSEEAQN
ncbi:MAG: hypothetical protein H0Z28_02680 [Archaeoglobus sp.]|nr:hypothetical protein [Archaeoglobus sp.]